MKTYKITSSHRITRDNYEDGCASTHCNYFDLSSTQSAECWLNAVINHLVQNCYLSLGDCEIPSYEVSDCGTYLMTSFTVDNDNHIASDRQYEAFKKGQIDLYIDDVTIFVQQLINVDLTVN